MRISDWSSDVCSSDLQNEKYPRNQISECNPGWNASDFMHDQRSFFLYMASMRSVTAKPPKIFTEARTTATRPSHLAVSLLASALAISAPTMMTEEIAFVTAISGVCNAGVTDQTT